MKDDVTRILAAVQRGDANAAGMLLPLVYDELRKLASQRLAQKKSGQTLQATALVHEAYPRRSDDKFITAWVAVFDSSAKTTSYVDAGHGYALMLNPDRTFTMLAEGDGMAVGLFADAEYASVARPLEPTAHAFVISDGLVEQYGLVRAADGTMLNEQFSIAGVKRALSLVPPDSDCVSAVFDAVSKHAGTTSLQDDATAVLVEW